MYGRTFAQSSPRRRCMHLRTAHFVSPFSDYASLSLFSCDPRSLLSLDPCNRSRSPIKYVSSLSFSSTYPRSFPIISPPPSPMRLYELDFIYVFTCDERSYIYSILYMRPVRAFYMHRHVRLAAASNVLKNTYRDPYNVSNLGAAMNGETSLDAGATWTLNCCLKIEHFFE